MKTWQRMHCVCVAAATVELRLLLTLLARAGNNMQINRLSSVKCEQLFLSRFPSTPISPPYRSLGMHMGSGPGARSAFSMAARRSERRPVAELTQSHLHVRDIVKAPFAGLWLPGTPLR